MLESTAYDPGGGPKGSSISENSGLSYSSATAPATGGGSDSSKPRMRTFAEILHEEQNHRNILEVKLERLSIADENGDKIKAKTLNEDDICDFLFDIVQLKVEDCAGIALRTHRYDTKEIKLKKNVDPSPYLRSDPVVYKNHKITITKQTNNLTRVTFRNVPYNIPDEEIIHLCKVYGEPFENRVYYEKPSARTRGIPQSTRYVQMKMAAGKQFENYYWLKVRYLVIEGAE